MKIPLILFSTAILVGYLMTQPVQSQTRPFKFDFDSIEIGTAEYPQGPTGCTVVYFPNGAKGAVDIRGGAAAVRESSSLASNNTWGTADAVVLAGGSTYGLEAADGVVHSLMKMRSNPTHFSSIPAVPAAIVYDFAKRENALYPDKALGEKAFAARKKNVISIGRAGGGANVTVGKYFGRDWSELSGQGAAFGEWKGVKIFVVTVVNALGNIVNEKGEIIAGSKDPKTGVRISVAEKLKMNLEANLDSEVPSGNTTITAVITNAKLSRNDLERVAAMSHTNMGSRIQPFHTPSDGDSLFAFTTDEVDLPKGMDVSDVGVLAGDLLNQAILGIFE